MVDISESLTRRVAELARLDLTDAEVGTFTAQLRQILTYVDQLQEVVVPPDTQPLVHPFSLTAPLRDDVLVPPARDADGNPKTLSPAPEVIDGGFKVPQII